MFLLSDLLNKVSKIKKSLNKTSEKRKRLKRQTPKITYLYSKYIILGSISVLVLGGMLFLRPHKIKSSDPRVLGTSTYLADMGSSEGSVNQSNDQQTSDQQQTDKIEPIHSLGHTDIPEIHQQVERVHQEVNKQIENKDINQIEIQPPQEGSISGRVILRHGNTSQEVQTPQSDSTPVTQITSAQAGAVSVHIAGPNTITISNGPYTITTKFSVIINPQDQTMAIKTPSGVTVIKTFPTQVFQSMPEQSKLTSVSSLHLTEQKGVPVYQANGIQIRKFLGIIPVQAQVQEQINAQTGQIINSNIPWYFSLFGFAFQAT